MTASSDGGNPRPRRKPSASWLRAKAERVRWHAKYLIPRYAEKLLAYARELEEQAAEIEREETKSGDKDGPG